MLDMEENFEMETTGADLMLEDARQTLEAAREAENKAYQGLGRAAALTGRQKGVMELVRLEEIEAPNREQLDRKCQLILESYYLPHILKDGYTAKLDQEFTRSGDSARDYIGAIITSPSGKEREVGYNYKTDEDGKNLLLFEKTFENVILKPGDPEKYVLYEADGTTELESFSTEELEKRISVGDVVKVEEGYFLKAKNLDGEIRKGDTTIIVEEEGDSNVKILMGNNEQEKYTISKTGQLVCATTNDVTTVTVETRKFASEGPIYDSADIARAAAEKEIHEGEANPRIDVTMEGTTVAEFSYIPIFTTNVELAGISRKIGKGIEGYDPSVSDEENLLRNFAKPINEYLDEKGFYVLDISCENLEADVSENVGFMNTIKTYQMTGGVVSVSYTKKFTATVTLKQKFLGRGQGNDSAAVLAQLPEGSELLNPQDIDWKNSKPEVAYITRGKVTGVGSAKTVSEADEKAVNSAIAEAQKVVVRSINGGIASGIREAMSGRGAASTLANVRARIETPVVSANDMELTHKDNKYAYSGSCDRLVSTVENKLVSVTTWNGSLLTYVEPTDPIIDKGIPTDENYDRYVNEGDDMAILLFEKSDRGLRRYMDDVQDAQSQAKLARSFYEKARLQLREAQETFDKIFDTQVGTLDESDVEELDAIEEPAVEPVMPGPAIAPDVAGPAIEPIMPEMPIEPVTPEPAMEPVMPEMPRAPIMVEMPRAPIMAEPAIQPIMPEMPIEPAEPQLSAQEALLAIFGEENTSGAGVAAAEPVMAEPAMTPIMPEMPRAPIMAEPAIQPIMPEMPRAPIMAEPAIEPVMPEMPVAPIMAEPQLSAQEALLAIFGEENTSEAEVAAEPVVAEPAMAPIMPEMPRAPIMAEPAIEPVMPEMPVEPAEPQLSAHDALLAIFGEENTSAPEVAAAEPVVAEPVIQPIMPEMPVELAEPQLSAHDALLAIFGEENTSAPEMTAEQPQMTEEPGVTEESKEPETAPAEVDVDAAWEKLLMGIPRED